jgi:hypothetical protein
MILQTIMEQSSIAGPGNFEHMPSYKMVGFIHKSPAAGPFPDLLLAVAYLS